MSDPKATSSCATHIPGFISADIELTNLCNNRCTMCPRKAITRGTGMMSRETFSSLLQFLNGSRCLLTFSGMGDPLLHRALPDFIGQAMEAGHQTGVVVHPASLMAPNGLVRLLSNPPITITVSFPSVRRHVFERLCPSISMEQALEQVRLLADRTAGRCTIRISGIICRLNRDEADEFRDFWKAQGLATWITRCHSRAGHLNRPELIEDTNRPGLHGGICSLFLFHSFVTWDGTILACCHDLAGETGLGSIGKNRIRHDVKTLGQMRHFSHFEQLLETKRQMTMMRPCPAFRLCARCDEPLRNIPLPAIPSTGKVEERRRFLSRLALLSGRSKSCR